MQAIFEKKLLEEKISLSDLKHRGNLQTTPKKEIQKEELQKAEETASILTPDMIDLIIQQNLS